MRMRVAHLGAVIAGCAIALAAPAAGAQKPTPAPEVAAAHTEHAAPITIRQILTYGRQNTWVAGVKLTERGNAYFGRAGQLYSRLGGWGCANGHALTHSGAAALDLRTLGGRSCDTNEVAVTEVFALSNRSRLITDFGTVRVGQTWRSVPKRIKQRVRKVTRTRTLYGLNSVYYIGRYQNYCQPHLPLPVSWQRAGTPSPVAVAVSARGVVNGVRVHPMIVEGVNCD